METPFPSQRSLLVRLIQIAYALPLCLLALVLPYGWRVRYFQAVAWFFHLPVRMFGRLSRFILRRTGEARSP